MLAVQGVRPAPFAAGISCGANGGNWGYSSFAEAYLWWVALRTRIARVMDTHASKRLAIHLPLAGLDAGWFAGHLGIVRRPRRIPQAALFVEPHHFHD